MWDFSIISPSTLRACFPQHSWEWNTEWNLFQKRSQIVVHPPSEIWNLKPRVSNKWRMCKLESLGGAWVGVSVVEAFVNVLSFSTMCTVFVNHMYRGIFPFISKVNKKLNTRAVQGIVWERAPFQLLVTGWKVISNPNTNDKGPRRWSDNWSIIFSEGWRIKGGRRELCLIGHGGVLEEEDSKCQVVLS